MLQLSQLFYFNSIKVQLKREGSVPCQSDVSDFNSIKVQLKQIPLPLYKAVLIYFNSIKVQLKQRRLLVISLPRQFQFHKGTIKTRDRADEG